MRNNIFEGVKFGDKFLTRDGRIVVFLKKYIQYEALAKNDFPWIYFITQDLYKLKVNENGLHPYNDNLDIVSKYKEPIDEDKLDKLADDECQANPYHVPEDGLDDAWMEGFKAGYRKAKEE